jgi:hypothetical protein
VHSAVRANTFAIHGNSEERELTELVPGILNQLDRGSLTRLGKLCKSSQRLQETEVEAEVNDDGISALVVNEKYEGGSKFEYESCPATKQTRFWGGMTGSRLPQGLLGNEKGPCADIDIWEVGSPASSPSFPRYADAGGILYTVNTGWSHLHSNEIVCPWVASASVHPLRQNRLSAKKGCQYLITIFKNHTGTSQAWQLSISIQIPQIHPL